MHQACEDPAAATREPAGTGCWCGRSADDPGPVNPPDVAVMSVGMPSAPDGTPAPMLASMPARPMPVMSQLICFPSCPIPGAVPPGDHAPASLTSESDPGPASAASAPVVTSAQATRTVDAVPTPAPPAVVAAAGAHGVRRGDQDRETCAGTLERALRAANMQEWMLLVGEARPTVTVELLRSMCILSDEPSTPAPLANCSSTATLQKGDVGCGDGEESQGTKSKRGDMQPCSIQWASPHTGNMGTSSSSATRTPSSSAMGKEDSEQLSLSDECAICLEPLLMGETIRLRCGHLFCLECTEKVRASLPCARACVRVSCRVDSVFAAARALICARYPQYPL